jgi:hypothetical protein
VFSFTLPLNSNLVCPAQDDVGKNLGLPMTNQDMLNQNSPIKASAACSAPAVSHALWKINLNNLVGAVVLEQEIRSYELLDV